MSGANERPEALEFLERLWALAHALETASRQMERTLGVTGPQRFLLRMVGRHPRTSAGQLAARLHLHPSTLTLLLAKLERRGLLARVSDPRDARRALFALTAAGKEIDRRTAGTIEGRVATVLRGLDAGEVQIAREVIGALAEGIGAAAASEAEVKEPGRRTPGAASAARRSRGAAPPRARSRRS